VTQYGATPSQNTGVNNGDAPSLFTLSDAARINSTVMWYEGHRRERKPSTLPRAAGGAGGGGTSVRTAYFYGGWLNGATKQIRFASNSAETASCTNYFQNLTPATGSGQNPRFCLVTPDDTGGTGYTLVNGGGC
jgi:hypothetical protein